MVAWKELCERPSVDGTTVGIEPSHIVRYEFAKSFCQGKRVLDGACGCGYGASILDAATYVGVDCVEENTRYGHHHYGKPANQYRLADLQAMPELGEFEVIVSFETIEHLKNPDAWLLYAAQRTDLFIGSTPIDNGIGLHSPHHVREYATPQFRELLGRYWNNMTMFYQDRRGFHMAEPAKEWDPIIVALCWGSKCR